MVSWGPTGTQAEQMANVKTPGEEPVWGGGAVVIHKGGELAQGHPMESTLPQDRTH